MSSVRAGNEQITYVRRDTHVLTCGCVDGLGLGYTYVTRWAIQAEFILIEVCIQWYYHYMGNANFAMQNF